MIKRMFSVALALCMILTAFVAVSVTAQELKGGIVATDDAGDAKTIFFTDEDVFFTLNFQVDDVPTAADFRVFLKDYGGNVHDWDNVYTQTGGTDGVYESWPGNPLYFDPGAPDDVYILEAVLRSTGQSLFTKQITGLTEKIIIEPTDRTIFRPDESVTISVDVDYDYLINVTIQPANVTWVNQSLTDFHWEKVWDLNGADVGIHDIWVNQSTDDSNLLWTWIEIGYLELELEVDRTRYLPGESATFYWVAKSIPEMEPVNASLDYSFEYRNGITGETEWINDTASDSPFSIAIPGVADIAVPGWDAILTGNATYNSWYKEDSAGIDLTTLVANLETDKNQYQPGEQIIVTVTALTTDGGLPIQGATVNVAIDRMGVPEGLGLANLTTGPDGIAKGIIDIPTDMEEDTYRIVATVSKLAYSDKSSKNIDVMNNWVIDVITDKTHYLGGEDIEVTVQIFKNGEAVVADQIEYWLTVGALNILPKRTTSAMSFSITAPEDTTSSAFVNVIASLEDGSVVLDTDSDTFSIAPLWMILSASKIVYNPGDKIEFEVLVVAEDTSGLDITYSITDADGAPVDSGTLSLGSDGTDTFELEIPEDNPSTSYTARVVLDDGEGLILTDSKTVTLYAQDYLLKTWIKTPPKYYTSGAYAPGQKLVVGFEVIPQRDEVPDIPLVTATVWFGWFVTQGETRTFTEMSGELTIVIPENAGSGWHTILVEVDNVGTSAQTIEIEAAGSGWDTNVAGLKAIDWLLLVLLIIVVLMMAIMMMRGVKGAPAGEPRPKPPKEEKKVEEYKPKATVDCPSCGTPIEVGTSKRPIEVMCPKCGASQIVK